MRICIIRMGTFGHLFLPKYELKRVSYLHIVGKKIYFLNFNFKITALKQVWGSGETDAFTLSVC